jgi:hypothetical protein
MNENVTLKHCRDGLMIYNRLDVSIGRSLEHYGEYAPGEGALTPQRVMPGRRMGSCCPVGC